MPKTLFFEYQTIRELVEYFVKYHSIQLSNLFNAKQEKTSESPLPNIKSQITNKNSKKQILSNRFNRFRLFDKTNDSKRSIASDPIAIVGLSGRYPESENIDAYWNNLREGKDCITEVPKDRWDWRDYYSDDRTEAGRHYSKWGGFIAGVMNLTQGSLIYPREKQPILIPRNDYFYNTFGWQ